MSTRHLLAFSLFLASSSASAQFQDGHWLVCKGAEKGIVGYDAEGDVAFEFSDPAGGWLHWKGVVLTRSGRIATLALRDPETQPQPASILLWELDGTFHSMIPMSYCYQLGNIATFASGTLAAANQSGHKLELFQEDGTSLGAIDLFAQGGSWPLSVYIDADQVLWVVVLTYTGNGDRVILRYDEQGSFLGEFPLTPGNFLGEPGAAVPDADGSVWVLSTNNFLYHLTSDGLLLDALGLGMSSVGGFELLPNGNVFAVGTNSQGNVYIEKTKAGANVQVWYESFKGNFPSVLEFPAVGEVYCTAKPNSQACTPAIAGTGALELSSQAPLEIAASSVLAGKPGLLFYGFAAAAIPFQDATLCVLPPLRRTLPQQAAGDLGVPCSGSYAFDMKAHIASGADALLVPGAQVFCQFWSRDPGVPSQTGLTDALALELAN